MAFCSHHWRQKEKCVWDSTLQVQRKATPERQGAPYFLCTGDANQSWTLHISRNSLWEDKQILARQERGVPLGSVTSPSLFPGYQQGFTLLIIWPFDGRMG